MRDSTPHFPSRRVLALSVVAMLGLGGLAACGDDEEADPQEAYCAAGEELRTSIEALLQIDLIAGGTDALTDAFDEVTADVTALRESGEEAAADEIGALEEAVSGIGDAIAQLGGDISVDNATAVGTALGDAAAAADAVFATLSDC